MSIGALNNRHGGYVLEKGLVSYRLVQLGFLGHDDVISNVFFVEIVRIYINGNFKSPLLRAEQVRLAVLLSTKRDVLETVSGCDRGRNSRRAYKMTR